MSKGREIPKTEREKKKMKNYNIYIKSNENPRTINTPTNARTYFTKIVVQGLEALQTKCEELVKNGKIITDIRSEMGTKFFFINGKIVK